MGALVAALLAGSAFAASPMAVAGQERALAPTVTKKQRKAAKRQKTALSSVAARYRRSKNPPAKRQLRANRLHISKRTRRRHRRAA